MYIIYVRPLGADWKYFDSIPIPTTEPVPPELINAARLKVGPNVELEVRQCNCDYCECHPPGDGCEDMPEDFDRENI